MTCRLLGMNRQFFIFSSPLRVNPLRLPLISVAAVDPVLAILSLFLLDTHLAFCALLPPVAHDPPPLFSVSDRVRRPHPVRNPAVIQTRLHVPRHMGYKLLIDIVGQIPDLPNSRVE